MKRSKLQVNIAILQTLAIHEKMVPTHITYYTYLNNKCVNESLKFLEDNNLVQDLGNKKRKLYTITEKGLRVVGVAKKINTLIPIFNEMHS